MSIEIIKLSKPQTVCTVKNEKGDICSGHLKEMMSPSQELVKQIPADHKLYRCKACRTIYSSPAQKHLQYATAPSYLPPQEF